MWSKNWYARSETLALCFVRQAMTEAGIEHGNVDDAHLTAAISKSSPLAYGYSMRKAPKSWSTSVTNTIMTSCSAPASTKCGTPQRLGPQIFLTSQERRWSFRVRPKVSRSVGEEPSSITLERLVGGAGTEIQVLGALDRRR
jgi:hypothetical protein